MVQKAERPYWENIRLIILGPGFNSQQNFGKWLNFLANLTNLTNLLTRNNNNNNNNLFPINHQTCFYIDCSVHYYNALTHNRRLS